MPTCTAMEMGYIQAAFLRESEFEVMGKDSAILPLWRVKLRLENGVVFPATGSRDVCCVFFPEDIRFSDTMKEDATLVSISRASPDVGDLRNLAREAFGLWCKYNDVVLYIEDYTCARDHIRVKNGIFVVRHEILT